MTEAPVAATIATRVARGSVLLSAVLLMLYLLLSNRFELPKRSDARANKRIISLLVPLFKANSDLGLQLSYLANAIERKRSMESVLPTVEFQLAVDASRTHCADFLQIFPEAASHLVWMEDLDESAFLATHAKQETWLRERYPFDDQASTDFTLSVDATATSSTGGADHAAASSSSSSSPVSPPTFSRDASWRQTAHHLQALLLQQSRDPRWQQRLGAQISLPFLVSRDALETRLVREFSAEELFPMHEPNCDRASDIANADETVVFVGQVEEEQGQFVPLNLLPKTKRVVLVLYDDDRSNYLQLQKYQSALENAGHVVHIQRLQSQAEAFCWSIAPATILLESEQPSALGEWIRSIAATAAVSSGQAPGPREERDERVAPF